MGGSAFTAPPYGLHTPRMPPNVYHHVKADCLAKLGELYAITASPVEAPGKKDFGDVDILVTEERSSSSPSSTAVPLVEEGAPPPISESSQEKKEEEEEEKKKILMTKNKSTHDQLIKIGEKLQARHSIILSPPVSANFAIPWPIEFEFEQEGEGQQQLQQQQQQQQEQKSGQEKRYIQVDVRICKDEQQVRWALFKHAHGDIWNIIGSLIRPYGLTVDEEALWIRIPEIEKHDRKQAKIKLTDDPIEVLDFIGMKYDDGFWEAPFESVDALFDYVTTCRLPLVRYPDLSDADAAPVPAAAAGVPVGGGSPSDGDNNKNNNNNDSSNNIITTASSPLEEAVVIATETKKSLKSNDRRRMNQRPVYRRWINEVMPRFLAEGRLTSIDGPDELAEMRARVRQQAFERFPGVENDYETRLKAWQVAKSIEAVKRIIKELAPPPTDKEENVHRRGTLISALKKTILEGDTSFLGVSPDDDSDESRPQPPPPPFKTEDGIYDLDAVRTFIIERGRHLGVVAWERHCGRRTARANLDNKTTGELQPGVAGLG